MERIEVETAWLICPCLADSFVGREAFEGLEAAAEIVGVDEVGQVAAEVVAGFVMEAFDGRLFEGSVHPFDLTVGPWVSRLGQAVIGVDLGDVDVEVTKRIGLELASGCGVAFDVRQPGDVVALQAAVQR